MVFLKLLASYENKMEIINRQSKKVVVGMSGGVDSSVAAYLLKEQGYDVTGVTMQIWQEDKEYDASLEGGCCGLSAVEDARRVAEMLDIPYYVMNFRQEFDNKVIRYFMEEYMQGRTPNPCIACNRYVKWESLLKRSLNIGADYIATGHYARVEKLKNGRYAVKNSVTAEKDQTYALYNLTQEQLKHTLMPVGEYTKDKVRAIAEEIGLKVAKKPDSMEICFIPDNDYAGFIHRNCGREIKPGNFIDTKGKIIGIHNGITNYTVGQRKGLNLSMGHPVFVSEIRPDTNEVVIGEKEDIMKDIVVADNLNFMALSEVDETKKYTAKIRYNHKGSSCRLGIQEDKLICRFDEPVRAVTPGQALVVYTDNYVALGGTIINGLKMNE